MNLSLKKKHTHQRNPRVSSSLKKSYNLSHCFTVDSMKVNFQKVPWFKHWIFTFPLLQGLGMFQPIKSRTILGKKCMTLVEQLLFSYSCISCDASSKVSVSGISHWNQCLWSNLSMSWSQKEMPPKSWTNWSNHLLRMAIEPKKTMSFDGCEGDWTPQWSAENMTGFLGIY